MKPEARRVTIYRAEGGWRYTVQSANWKTIDVAAASMPRSLAMRRVRKLYPEAEIVVRP